MGRLPEGTTRQHGSGPQVDSHESFVAQLEVALGDPSDEEVAVLLDLPSEPEAMMTVGPRRVNCSLGHGGEIYVEASVDSIAAAGLFFADGEPATVVDIAPVEYRGTPWSRVMLEVDDVPSA